MDVLTIVVGVAGLWFGTELTIRGAVSVAQRFHLSEFVIGAVILSVGSDIPELAVAIDAGIRNARFGDASDVVVGTAVGSALAQIGFVLGFVGLFGYLTAPRRVIFGHGGMLLGSIVLLAFAGADGSVTRTEGISLLIVYFVYFAYVLVDRSGSQATIANQSRVSTSREMFYLIAGVALVILSSEFTVAAAIRMAESLQVQPILISIFLIGLGSSLPELSISLVAVLKGRNQLSVGNLIGSNIFDTLVPVGAAAIISSIEFSRTLLFFELPVLLFLSLVVLFLLNRVKGLQKHEAAIVLTIFLVYAFFRVTTIA